MGLHHSPLIATTGLTLCIDPANKLSYAGTGTSVKNLANTAGVATLTGSYSANNAGIFDDAYAVFSSSHSSVWALGSNLTIDAWIYFIPTASNTYRYVFSTGNPSISNSWDISLNTVNYRFYINGGIKYLSAPSYASLFGVWSNLTFVLRSGNMTAYINGVSQGVWLTGQSFTYDSNTFDIGAGTASGFTGGTKIGQFKIYNRPLSRDEILSNFNALRGRYGI